MKLFLTKNLILIVVLSAFIFSSCKKEDKWIDWKVINEDALADTIARLKSDPNFTVTASGIGYKRLRPINSSDARPGSSSYVIVNYDGRLITNKYFTSNNKNDTLFLGNSILGWQQVLPKMYIGDLVDIYIPWNLGYGTKGSGINIPPYSTLIFRVALKEVL